MVTLHSLILVLDSLVRMTDTIFILETDELSPTLNLNNKSGTVKNCPDIPLQSHQNAVVVCSTNSERRRNDDDGMTPSTSELPSTSSSMKRTDTMNEKTNPSSFRCDDYGFPLSIFTKVFSFSHF